MSKKRIYAIVVAASLFTGYSVYHAQNKQELSDTLLANVEALASGANESIETGTCYIELSGDFDSSHRLFCDRKTDDTHIYSCPTSNSYGRYSERHTDRCIK